MTDRSKITIAARYIVDIRGKQFVLCKGLIDSAHRANLLASLLTTPLTIPTETYQYAAALATATTPDGETFTGLGEAEPANVSGPMRTSLLRIAETRAISRALQRLLNVEHELYDDDAPERQETAAGAAQAPRQAAPAARIPVQAPARPVAPVKAMSTAARTAPADPYPVRL
jgi:hypothetical protein